MDIGVDAANARGQKVSRGPYSGLKQTVDKCAYYIREGRNDPAVTGWAGDVLIAAGRPQGHRRQAQAIVDAFRRQTVYVPDAVGTERIASAAATLCLRPGLCVRARDCDDGIATVGAALMSIGISVQIVTQRFKGMSQPHVLLVALDDDNKTWFYVDPGGSPETSHPETGLAVGQAFKADEEEWIDPLDAIPSMGVGKWVAELVGFGGVGAAGVSPIDKRSAERAMMLAERSMSRVVYIIGAAGWNPIVGETTVNGGDIVRGSFDFSSIDSALYPGPNPIDYLRYLMPSLFKGDGSDGAWAVWNPGDTLPSDWPVDDVNAAKGWHFRAYVPAGTHIKVTPSTVSAMKLWVNPTAPKVDPPKVDPPKVDPPKVDPPRVDPNQLPNNPLTKDENPLGTIVIYGGAALVAGYAGYRMFKWLEKQPTSARFAKGHR